MTPDAFAFQEWDAQRLQTLVQNVPGAIYRLCPGDWSMQFMSDAIESISGYAAAEFVGPDARSYASIIHPEDLEMVTQRVFEALDRREPYVVAYRIIHRDGSVRWVQGHGRGAFSNGNVDYLDGVTFDITMLKETEAGLAHRAMHDNLTDLPNRALFQEHLTVGIAHADRTETGIAVLFIDLDDFKLINDSLGHAVGDELLVEVAARLRSAIRADDVVARQGGDEFLVLMHGPSEDGSVEALEDAARAVATTLRLALAQPFTVDGAELYVTASVGASLYPADADTHEGLLKHADSALYAAKDAGRDGYRLYRRPERDSSRALALASRLRQAERRDEFVLHYQPLVDLQASCVVGAEALIRWRTQDGSLVAPSEFIPIAERTGLIRTITAWVLETACVQTRRWCDRDLDLFVSINLPAAFWHPAGLRRALATIESFGLTADRIMFEITEQSAMTNPADLDATLVELRDRGMRLAIDDFGAGYSSLGRLTQLHVDTLKIDRSFIRDVPHSKDAAILVESIITLADKLGLQCLAEGIETEAQLQFLVDHGCPLGQGFLFSRALPAAEFDQLITGRRAA
ncbi:MAG: putative bifunctional diguanylate cyclase/phosphodiesterase [Gaiellales bacterium]